VTETYNLLNKQVGVSIPSTEIQ